MNKSTYTFNEKDGLRTITTYQAGVMQASVHRLLQKHSDTVLKPYGITKMHWLIIGTILDTGQKGIRLTDLAKTVGTTMSYLTTTINLLEAKQMIMRADHGGDSRAKLLVINPSFVPKCAEIEATMRKALRESIYAQVNPKEFETYIRVLYQLANVTPRQ